MKSLVAIGALTLLYTVGITSVTLAAESSNDSAPMSSKKLAARDAMRNLWTDHIFWVRAAVVAKHDKNAEAEKVAEDQVVANARQIADAVVPFYGKEGADKLFELLAGHWGAIKAYLEATDADDKEGARKAQEDLYANAATLSKFLSDANPNWPYDTVHGILTVHAAHHIAQIQQTYSKNYDQEAKTWAQMREHMNLLGDALADGLAAQFPDKF